MPPRLEQALGALLVLLVLVDVFLTVLYARLGTSIVTRRVAFLTWWLFHRGSKPFGRRRYVVLSFCGPVVLVLMVGVWALALTVGLALVMQPELGRGIQATSGGTPTDFVSAMHASGSSMAVVGSSDFSPRTSALRLLYLFNSVIGMSVMSLTLTYLLQVYTALHQRNALGLKLHLLAGETGDAAELLARIGPEGKFETTYSNIAELASAMTEVKEAHHFYPVLFYFRFREPYYAVSRFAFVTLDATTLLESALDDERYGWFKRSASVAQLRRAAMVLVTTLEDTFLPGGAPDGPDPPHQQTLERWRHRYGAALVRLREAGIRTIADERVGAELYLSSRAGWDRYVAALAPAMGFDLAEIDPAGRGLAEKG
jgi:hypothetical protein